MRKDRVHGPYKHGQRWRIRITTSGGAVSVESFETLEDAERNARAYRAEISACTVVGVMRAYLEHLRTYGGPKKDEPLRESTIRTIRHRLEAFFQTETSDRALIDVTPAVMQSLYKSRVARTKTDTHRNELLAARTFLEWCIGRGIINKNPADTVRGMGKRSTGKEKLLKDDARAFLRRALLPEQGNDGLACALALVMGLRASEISGLQCRCVDNAGTELRVLGGKTRAAERSIAIPGLLRARLLALKGGRKPTDQLFQGLTRYKLHHHVGRICREARVPIVCPHGLRGSAITIAAQGSLIVAQQLAGHEAGASVTERAYIQPGTLEGASAARKAEVLTGTDLGMNPGQKIPNAIEVVSAIGTDAVSDWN
jgi:integrase